MGTSSDRRTDVTVYGTVSTSSDTGVFVRIDNAETIALDSWVGLRVALSDYASMGQEPQSATAAAASTIGSGGDVPMTPYRWLEWARSNIVRAIAATAERRDSQSHLQRLGHVLGGIDEALDRDADLVSQSGIVTCPPDLAADEQCPSCLRWGVKYKKSAPHLEGLVCNHCGWECHE
jgi:hypothetical protein